MKRWGAFVLALTLAAASALPFVLSAARAADSWATRSPMPTERANLALVAVDDLVYAIGGFRWQPPTGDYSASLDAYDPATDTWSARAPMPEATYSLAAAAVGHAIYTFGGMNASGIPTSRVWVYDILADAWSAGPALPVAVQGACAVTVGTSIHVIDGALDSSGQTRTSVHHVLDTGSGTWRTLARDPVARSNAACAAIGDFVYVFGDIRYDADARNSIVAYDVLLDRWTARSSPSYSINFWGLRAAVVGSHLFWIGGQQYASPMAQGVTEEYDPATDTWTDRARMPTSRADLGVAVVNGRIYAIGGANYGSQAWYAVNEEYAPVLDASPPTVAITWPASGSSVTTDRLDVRGTASDDAGVLRVLVRVNGNSWVPANGTTDWTETVALVPGPNVIEAQAFDTSGNPSPTVAVTVTFATVANTPPTGRFSTNPPGGTTDTVFGVDASASSDAEDALAVLEVRWDWDGDGTWDTPWSSLKTATHRYPTPGTYAVRLAVRDSGGLTGTTTVPVTVGSAAPTPPPAPAFPEIAWILVEALLAGVAAFLWFLRLRRTRPPPSARPGDHPS